MFLQFYSQLLHTKTTAWHKIGSVANIQTKNQKDTNTNDRQNYRQSYITGNSNCKRAWGSFANGLPVKVSKSVLFVGPSVPGHWFDLLNHIYMGHKIPQLHIPRSGQQIGVKCFHFFRVLHPIVGKYPTILISDGQIWPQLWQQYAVPMGK